jgi:polyadenylate-binding protein
LNKDITNKQLYDTCSDIGDIKSVRIPVDQEGHSKGYGYVQFESEKDAEVAIARLNGLLIEGSKVTVAAYIPRAERIKSTELTFTNVFVKNVPLDWDQAKFVEVCSQFGTVTSPFFPTNEEGKGKGFAFANFATPEMAKKAVEGLPEVDVGEKDKIWAGRALKKSELVRIRYNQKRQRQQELDAKNPNVNLYVKHLAETVTDEVLKEAFSKFGTITSARVMKDTKGIPRGFGFVCFSQREEAAQAISGMHGEELHGKPLYVALHQRKEERLRKQRMESRNHAFMYPNMPNMPMRFPPNYPMMMPPVQMQQMFQMFNQHQLQTQQHQQPGRRMQQMRGNFRGVSHGHGRVNQHKQQQKPQPAKPQQQPQQQQQQQQPQQSKLTAHLLASSSEADKRKLIGEQLYPQVYKIHAPQAGKITGMLLEMETSELFHLFDDQAAL